MIKSTEETTIRKILRQYKINFKEQYRIKECKNKLPLPFDFALFDKNNNLILLIEYDGKQHYVEYQNTYYDSLDETKRRDQIKTDFCIKNNIELLRIPYYQRNNIKYILLNKIRNLMIGEL
jgi:hypothetical protein